MSDPDPQQKGLDTDIASRIKARISESWIAVLGTLVLAVSGLIVSQLTQPHLFVPVDITTGSTRIQHYMILNPGPKPMRPVELHLTFPSPPKWDCISEHKSSALKRIKTDDCETAVTYMHKVAEESGEMSAGSILELTLISTNGTSMPSISSAEVVWASGSAHANPEAFRSFAQSFVWYLWISALGMAILSIILFVRRPPMASAVERYRIEAAIAQTTMLKFQRLFDDAVRTVEGLDRDAVEISTKNFTDLKREHLGEEIRRSRTGKS